MAADDGGTAVTFVTDAAPEPERRSSDMPFTRGDVFHGFYYCAQGRTALVLTIEEADDEGLEATFAFDFKGSSRTAPTQGSFRMHGTWEAKTKHLDLKAERWIDQPNGWEMVDLAMTLQKTGALNGTVGGGTSSGCSTVQLTPDTPKNVR